MEERYEANFREHKKMRIVRLCRGVVRRIAENHRGTLAYIVDQDTGLGYKFWVRKDDQPLGSRCKVQAQTGEHLPTISREKSDFEVRIDTIVLFAKPKKNSAAFPVISWDEYQNALRKIRSRLSEGEACRRLRRGEHRWVDGPFHPRTKNAPD